MFLQLWEVIGVTANLDHVPSPSTSFMDQVVWTQNWNRTKSAEKNIRTRRRRFEMTGIFNTYS